jgi:hypothetical protein
VALVALEEVARRDVVVDAFLPGARRSMGSSPEAMLWCTSSTESASATWGYSLLGRASAFERSSVRPAKISDRKPQPRMAACQARTMLPTASPQESVGIS